MIQPARHNRIPDVLIVGAGVLGLWAARHAILRGETVALVEKRHVGAGASGGFLGALMPHMPDSWNPKKQHQYDGLSSIGDAVSALEADTGLSCGFRRCGRIMPLTHAKILKQVGRRIQGAFENWHDRYEMKICDKDAYPDWLSPELAPEGIQQDTLSARINPRAYLSALDAFVRPRGEITEGKAVTQISVKHRQVVLSNGERHSAGRIVFANGWEAYTLLQPFMNDINDGEPIGRGVKGQAVLLEHVHDDRLPIVYHDGTYVVPQEGNRIAVGSTSHNTWSGPPDAFDTADMAFYRKAIELVPAIEGAPIIARWAGVRPRNTLKGRGTSPWFGPVPGCEGVSALIGGFKITFGLAHLDHFTCPFGS